MPARDPHHVLGVAPGAAAHEVRAAWRSLARQHHPDLTADDPEAVRRATRRMAEINAAYAQLSRGAGDGPRRRRAADGGHATGPASGARPGGGVPPPPKSRPVTGRVDTSATVQPRNQTTTPPGVPVPLAGWPPLRPDRPEPELRASQPSGPLERDRLAGHVPPGLPALDEALGTELPFGKFHGHTLGEVAAFEPSYIDWLAGTPTRVPEVTMAARAVRAELDRRGIRRRPPQRS